MEPVTGFDYFAVEFDKAAKPVAQDNAQFTALEQFLQSKRPSDLIVISHGWNNDIQEAQDLYHELLSNMRKLLDQGLFPALAGRTFAVLGVLWPSKKFAEKDLIPSGADGLTNPVAVAAVREQLQGLKGAFDAKDGDAKLTELQGLLPRLEDSTKAQRQFIEICRTLVKTRSGDTEAQSNSFFDSQDALDVFQRLQLPTSYLSADPVQTELGGAQGLGDSEARAAGLSDFFSGVVSGARNALNYTTYYLLFVCV